MKPSESVNMQAWVEDLRTTEAPQAIGMLALIDHPGGEEEVSYCCLGRGCEVMIEAGVQVEVEICDGDDLPYRLYDGQSDIPSSKFGRWLGFTSEQLGTFFTGDYIIDWPYDDVAHSRQQGVRSLGDLAPLRPNGAGWGVEMKGQNLRLTSFNDTGVTFAQIADLIEYFGILPWSG